MICSSSVRQSRFSLSAFSSASLLASRMTKAMAVPSGDHSSADTPPFSSVTCSASPPDTSMRQMLALPLRDETKAIVRPSGDQRGSLDDLSPRVIWRLADPSAEAR